MRVLRGPTCEYSEYPGEYSAWGVRVPMGYHSRCHPEHRPCESKRGSLPVSTQSTPMRTPGTPGTPVLRVLRCALRRRGALRPALRCRAARSTAATYGTGPAADAAPGTPPARAGTPSTVPSHRAARDIDRDIVRRGDPPRPREALPLGRATVPRALEVLSSEGTQHTLAVLRDLMQVLTVLRVLRAPNLRTTDRDGSGQLCCPIANEYSQSACALESIQSVM
jgi:hypothetical protein